MKKLGYFLITSVLLVFIYFKVDFSRSFEVLKNANMLLITVAILLGVINSYIIALRIRTLFSAIKTLPVSYFWALSFVGSFVSLVFPFSLGGFSMGYFLAKKAKIGYSKSFLVVFGDFLIAMFPTLIFAPFALLYFYQDWMYVIIPVILSPILLFFYKSKIVFIKKTVLFLVKSKLILSKTLLLTLLVWMLANIQFYLYFLAFNLTPNFFYFIAANILLSVLSLIPGSPGKIGQYEAFGLLTLPSLLHLDPNAVFTAMLSMRLLSTFTILILGYVSFHFLDINPADILRKRKNQP